MILQWVINAAVLFLIAYLYPGVALTSYYSALATVLFLGLVNVFIRPVALFFTLPLNVITLGLFTFVVNGFMFWFVSSFVKGFEVHSLWTAIVGALLYSVATWLISDLTQEKKIKKNK